MRAPKLQACMQESMQLSQAQQAGLVQKGLALFARQRVLTAQRNSLAQPVAQVSSLTLFRACLLAQSISGQSSCCLICPVGTMSRLSDQAQ